MGEAVTETRAQHEADVTKLDALIIGAGVAGLYQLYQLRNQGLKARAYDSASGVGGTWYWNRYPGARFDSECYIYQYLFSEDLYKKWSWSQRFPGQTEIERWMNYVADELDLKKDIQLSTAIESARWNEDTGRWTVATDGGEVIDTRFLITCCGMLSAPMESVFPGQDDFKGKIFHTARWPNRPIDIAGKRVGVVGIGATGIQVIQTIADEVGHLKVFVRTPQYVLPMKNPTYSEEDKTAYKARFDELKATIPTRSPASSTTSGRAGRSSRRSSAVNGLKKFMRTARSSSGSLPLPRCFLMKPSAKRSPSSCAKRCAPGSRTSVSAIF